MRDAPTGWTADLAKREARHVSGLTVRFTPAEDGALDGKIVRGNVETIRAEDGAQLMRAAGEVFADAIQARRRALLTTYGERVHGPDWRSAVARTLGPFHPDGARDAIDQRLVSRWASGQRPIPQWAIRALGAQVEELAEAFREAL